MQNKSTTLNFKGENIYVGIDTHKRNWGISLYTKDIALKTFTQNPDPDLLVNFLHKNYPLAQYYCAYEAGFCGFWIQKHLESKGVHCIVVNPADIPTTNKEKEFKTDPRDCRKIAKSLRSDLLTPIHIHSNYNIACRGIVRTYNDVVKNQTRFKNKIKSLINFYGVKYPQEFNSEIPIWSKAFTSWLIQLRLDCEENTWTFQYYVNEYLKAKEQVKLLTGRVKTLAKTKLFSKSIHLLCSIPGIGIITAMKILTELEDIKRFKNLDQLCGYIGLVPTTKSSGDKDKVGEMTNRGNKHLKTAIIESAWSCTRYDPAMSQKYIELRKRMEKNKAIVRIAKKLLARIMYVLINEKEYKIRVVN
ncbi:MAG: IS110 family transposase [Bacteroidales bacterium]|nr:IS110 family transposase [Bacteroidales bacterium]